MAGFFSGNSKIKLFLTAKHEKHISLRMTFNRSNLRSAHLNSSSLYSWCGVVWYDGVWCGVVWYDGVWCGVVWYDGVWCGVVWYDGVWCGVVWYDGVV